MKYDIFALSNNVNPTLNQAKKTLDNGKAQINAISIPGDFPEGKIIIQAAQKISSISSQILSAQSSVTQTINNLNKASQNSRLVINSIGELVSGTIDISKKEKNHEKNIIDINKNKKKLPKTEFVGFIEKIGDGFNQVYTTKRGKAFKDFKQFEGLYKDQKYWKEYDENGGNMHKCGCGPSALAVLLSAIIQNITPGKVAKYMTDKCGDETNKETLKKAMDHYVLKSEIIDSPTPNDIVNYLNQGKYMVFRTAPGTVFCEGPHAVAVVDVNKDGQVLVMNPGISIGDGVSGWYDPNELTKNSDTDKVGNYAILTDLKNIKSTLE